MKKLSLKNLKFETSEILRPNQLNYSLIGFLNLKSFAI